MATPTITPSTTAASTASTTRARASRPDLHAAFRHRSLILHPSRFQPTMKQVLLQRGRAVTDEVPAPLIEAGTVLVAADRSCISVGTELSGLRRSGMPVWQLAMRYPQHARKAIDTVATLGVARTWSLVQGQLSAGSPVGYS